MNGVVLPAVSSPARFLRIDCGIATLELPRCAVDPETAQALCEAVDTVAFDPSVRVVVLQAPGGSGRADAGAAGLPPDWISAIGSLAVPVIGAVEGDAIGEGAEVMLACDMRIAAARARFAFPQVTEGRFPSGGATQRLPRAVGRMRALDLLLSGRRIGAREALRIGLVSRVVPDAQLAAVVRATAQAIARRGPIALRLAKEAVARGLDLSLEQGLRLEHDLYVLLQTTADRREGIAAFLARRAPRFRGE